MALCTSCGNQVEESASFCTSCGKPMPAAAHPSAAVTVSRPVCSSCGAPVDPDSVFCTECGKRLDAQPAPVAEAVAAVAANTPSATETVPPSLTVFCTHCGTRLDPRTGFCTNCGQPVADGSTKVPDAGSDVAPALPTLDAPQTMHVNEVAERPITPERTETPMLPGPIKTTPASSTVEAAPVASTIAPLAEPGPIEQNLVTPAPQVAAPLYATPSDYPPVQPRGGAFRVIVLVLLLLILVGGLGGWYFMGVETVIVCSPPDVTVFLDGKELAPTSYGRYVVPHLSRQPHLLKVQRPGFADTIERLDFPLASLHEWVNIKLVPHRQTLPSSLH